MARSTALAAVAHARLPTPGMGGFHSGSHPCSPRPAARCPRARPPCCRRTGAAGGHALRGRRRRHRRGRGAGHAHRVAHSRHHRAALRHRRRRRGRRPDAVVRLSSGRGRAVTNLGDGINPNVEAILAVPPRSRPPLQLGPERGRRRPAARARHRRGPAQHRPARGRGSRVGGCSAALTGHDAGADCHGAGVRHGAGGGHRRRPRAGGPKVLLLVWEQPPMTIGRGSFLTSWSGARAARTSSTT